MKKNTKTIVDILEEVKEFISGISTDVGWSRFESKEEIITQNSWGFSIFDPETGITEYYASKGGYLGKRSIQ